MQYPAGAGVSDGKVHSHSASELVGRFAICDAQGRVRALRGHQVNRVERDGRVAFEPVPGSDFEMPADGLQQIRLRRPPRTPAVTLAMNE